MSTALTGTAQDAGAENSMDWKICKSASELATSLNIDQSLSVSYAGLGSVDEKTSFFSSLNITTYSLSIVVYAKNVTGSQIMADVQFKSDFKMPSTQDQLREFFSSYGDSFVSSVTRGGEYYAVYTFYTETKEEQSSLETKMHASGIYSGVSASADLSIRMSNFSKETVVRSSFHQNCSGIKNVTLPPSEGICEFALKFPSLVLDAPNLISNRVAGYEMVPGFHNQFSPIARTRAYFTGDQFNAGQVSNLGILTTVQNQIHLIESIYEFYGASSDQLLLANKAAVAVDIAKIRKQMSDYYNDPLQTFTAPLLPSLQLGTPTLTWLPQSAQFGDNSGDPFDDVDFAAYLRCKTRITALWLETGDAIDRFSSTYTNDNKSWQTSYGGPGGDTASNPLQLLQGRFVVRLSGRLGDGVASVYNINIYDSDGNSIGGGRCGENAFDWRPPAGSFIMGFFGRVRTGMVRTFGVHYAQFQAAQWHPLPDESSLEPLASHAELATR